MATFEEAKNRNENFKCDACDEKFSSNDVVLVEPADNIKIITPMMPFVYVDKDGIITGGSKEATKERGDKLLACPHCKAPHIFGFTRV